MHFSRVTYLFHCVGVQCKKKKRFEGLQYISDKFLAVSLIPIKVILETHDDRLPEVLLHK